MRQAFIRAKDKRFPFGLRVRVTPTGVRWDRLDSSPSGRPFLVLNTSVKSARVLAKWILDNTEADDG